jgi:LysM repeat protein
VPGIRVHIVRADGTETKAEIATRNGVTEPDLDRANPGFNWAGLAPGQSIVIPVH